MKLLTASFVALMLALTGCALDGSDPEPADQQQPPPKQEETSSASQAPPPVVVDTGTTPLLKTRH